MVSMLVSRLRGLGSSPSWVIMLTVLGEDTSLLHCFKSARDVNGLPANMLGGYL